MEDSFKFLFPNGMEEIIRITYLLIIQFVQVLKFNYLEI